MSHVASKGVVHLDLAARNVLLSRAPNDDYDVAKISDFGLAKFVAGRGEQEEEDEAPSKL